jgi:amino acid permease
MLPNKPTSLFEIGFIIVGRKAIFINALNNLVTHICLTMIYFMIFSATTTQFVGSLFDKSVNEVWYTSKSFYVILLGVILIPVVLRKQLKQFKILATLLFTSIGIFILITFFLLTGDLRFTRSTKEENYLFPKYSFNTFSAILTTIVAYSYHSNVFPIYNSLEVRTPANYSKVSKTGLLTTALIYMSVATIAILCFGSSLQSSVLLNFGDIRTPAGESYFETYVV